MVLSFFHILLFFKKTNKWPTLLLHYSINIANGFWATSQINDYISHQHSAYTMETLLPEIHFQNKICIRRLPPSPQWKGRERKAWRLILKPRSFLRVSSLLGEHTNAPTGSGWTHRSRWQLPPLRWGSCWPEPCCCRRPPITSTCRCRAESASRGSWCCWMRCSGASCRRWERGCTGGRLMWGWRGREMTGAGPERRITAMVIESANVE